MNCKITQRQADQIRYLVNVEKKKLREVAYPYFLSISQIHRIAKGTNWQSVTRPTPLPSNTEHQNAASKR